VAPPALGRHPARRRRLRGVSPLAEPPFPTAVRLFGVGVGFLLLFGLASVLLVTGTGPLSADRRIHAPGLADHLAAAPGESEGEGEEGADAEPTAG